MAVLAVERENPRGHGLGRVVGRTDQEPLAAGHLVDKLDLGVLEIGVFRVERKLSEAALGALTLGRALELWRLA